MQARAWSALARSEPDPEPSADPRRHLELVRRIAGALAKRLPRHIERDELIALGNLGLVEACARFDTRRRVAFSTFATLRIRGAMLDGLRRLDPLAREERARLRHDEVATASVVLVEMSPAADGMEAGKRADELLEEREQREQLARSLEALPARRRRVLERHYFDQQPLHSIGRELGVSESRVCQLVAESVATLRQSMEPALLEGMEPPPPSEVQ